MVLYHMIDCIKKAQGGLKKNKETDKKKRNFELIGPELQIQVGVGYG